MELLTLDNLSKQELAKELKVELKESFLEIKRLGVKIKIRELDNYDTFEAMEKGAKANDFDSSVDANAFMLLKGVTSPSFKDIEVQKKLEAINPIVAIRNLFTAEEIGEIALKIRDLGKKEDSIKNIDIAQGL